MLLRESILEHIDYNVREPVRLLNMFNGVDTSQSCSGHIQEGDTRNERAIRYIPGLKRVAVSIRNVDNGNSLDIVPEHYELNGKEIDIEEFIRGAFCHHDDLIISPLDDIQSHKHENLSFTGLHLLFSRFECKDNKTRELKKRLHMIYNETEAIDIRHGQWRYDGDGVCFSAAGKRFNPCVYDKKEIAEIKREYGSLNSYWKNAINVVSGLQYAADMLWKRIESECNDILQL